LFNLTTKAHHDRSIRERVIALAEEGGLTAILHVKCEVSGSLRQGHGCRNTAGMGKLESAEELAYCAYPTQDAALLAEAQRNPFLSSRNLKAATGFPGQKKII
jgi:hypothetical protein